MSATQEAPSTVELLMGLVKDHAELASLEWENEKIKGWRRLLGLGAGAALFFAAFLFAEVFLGALLLAAGLPLWQAAILGIVINAGGGGVILYFEKRRRAMADKPFESSKAELERSLRWIERNIK